MPSLAISNEDENYYTSIPVDDSLTAPDVLEILTTEKIWFPGPFTFIEEQAHYIPDPESSEFTDEPLDPNRDVLVYDCYGPHGVQNIGQGYDSTLDVKEWIDTRLEPKGMGEYAIGQSINPEEMP